MMMSENTPMIVENLAVITYKSNKKIQNILDKLIYFEMLICEDNIYKIKNLDKYQNADNMSLLRNKIERQKRFRENKKNENNVDLTLGNGKERNKKR